MKNIILLVAAFLIITTAQAQTNTSIDSLTQMDTENIKRQTNILLESFLKEINKDNYKMMGFDSLESIRFLTFSKAYAVLIIQLDDLRKYKKGEDPVPIIKNTGRALCLLKNSRTGLIESAVELERIKENWNVKGIASSGIAKSFNKIENNMLELGIALVRIPSLNLYFIASHESGNKLQFVSLQDYPSLKISTGEKREAAAFLEQLVPVANAYNGLPR
jgi:hypothetical protein